MSTGRTTLPAALFFHLLNLDAPAVAVAWQILFSKCLHVPLKGATVAALAITVWLIYCADRLLDVFGSSAPAPTRRHRFHRTHARALVCAVFAAVCLLAATCSFLRPPVVADGVALSAVVAVYFCLIHALPQAAQQWCPKELVVGIVFACGTCLAAWTRLGDSRELLAPAGLFAALCCLNCVAIEAWEWRRFGAAPRHRPHAVTLWLADRLRMLCVLIACMAAALCFVLGARPLFAAIGLSALAFVWLAAEEHRIPVDVLRVLADLPLLSPLLLIGLQ